MQTKPIKKCIGATLGATEIISVKRKEGADTSKARDLKVAVITDEALVRGIVTAVRWIGGPLSSFTWLNLPGALRWLDIRSPVDQRFLQRLEATKRRVQMDLKE